MSNQQFKRRMAKLEREEALGVAQVTKGSVPQWMRNGSAPPADIPSADPVEFSRYAFGHDPWGVQAEILRSVVSNSRTAAIRGDAATDPEQHGTR